MASRRSRWCWLKVSWFVVACLSSVTGECPEGNVVKVAVNDTILSGEGFPVVRSQTGTSLKLSCLWPSRGSCKPSSLPQTQGALVTLDGIDKTPPVLSCVDVLAGSDVEEWYESTIRYVVQERRVKMQCSFDECGISAVLTIRSGSRSVPSDPSYCLVQSGAHCPRTPSTSTTATTTSAPSKSTETHSTHETTAPPATIPGLNPLIYTLLAVTLLGTASIVAMISCYMRHRRIMQRRREALFGREYLDYMGEQDFTTVTTNQLLASLSEAPPTYQQSEVIEQQLRQAEDSNDDEETPPPLPPRNTSAQARPVEPEAPQPVTGAGETEDKEEGDKDDRPIEPITTESEEEEDTHSVKDGDSTPLIR